MNKLLVIVDPTSQVGGAIDRAAWLAAKLGASIELFVCEYDQFVAKDKRAVASLIANHKKRLEKRAEPLRQAGIDVTVDAVWDRPLDEGIVRKARDSGADLVVKDTHYHAAIRRAFFSNTDWNLIRSCPVPLLLVKPLELTSPLRVVAAIDPFHADDIPAALDHRIIETAATLGAAVGAELRVVHCFNDRALSATTVVDSATIDGLEKTHRDAVIELLEVHGIDASAAEICRGAPQEELPDAATRLSADILVTGAVSRGALRRMLVGRTAERLLDRVPCDLLVVKPAAFESTVP